MDSSKPAVGQQPPTGHDASQSPLLNRTWELPSNGASHGQVQASDGRSPPAQASAVKQESSCRGDAIPGAGSRAGDADTRVQASEVAAASSQLPEAAENVTKSEHAADEMVDRSANAAIGNVEPDDVSNWQAFAPSWLPAVAQPYERDAPGLGALLAALQEWIDGGHPPLSFVDDPQRLVDELAVCIDAAKVAVPEPLQSSAGAGSMLRRLEMAQNQQSAGGTYGSDVDYAVPAQQNCQNPSSSSGSSGSTGHNFGRRRGAEGLSSGSSLRQLKRPNSGVLTPVGEEEGADSVSESRARGGIQAGRHAGLPGLAGLTAKRPSVKSRLMKKLRLR